MSNYVWFALLVLVAVACGEVAGSADSRFVAVNSLIDQQVRLLDSLRSGVEKRVRAQAAAEVKTFEQTNWQKELAGFRVADISKPGLRGAYTVQDSANTRVFRLKPGENAEVQELIIAFAADKRVASIRVMVDEENYLYHTQRHLEMHFNPYPPQWRLSSYRIEGFQQLLWSPRQVFDVQATVRP